MLLREEVPKEVPHTEVVESLTHVPRLQEVAIPVEIPKIVRIEPRERTVEVPTLLTAERAVPIDIVEEVESIVEVIRPVIEVVDKGVPRYELQAVERVVPVPQTIYEEHVVDVPQVQTVEAMRQQPVSNVTTVQKQFPRVSTTVAGPQTVATTPVSAVPSLAVVAPPASITTAVARRLPATTPVPFSPLVASAPSSYVPPCAHLPSVSASPSYVPPSPHSKAVTSPATSYVPHAASPCTLHHLHSPALETRPVIAPTALPVKLPGMPSAPTTGPTTLQSATCGVSGSQPSASQLPVRQLGTGNALDPSRISKFAA